MATFEIPGKNIIEILAQCKSYWDLGGCFLYDGNPYIDRVYDFKSDDNSYIEVYSIFHDKNFYELWFDEFKDIYVPYKAAAFAELRKANVIITEYMDDTNIVGADEGVQLTANFKTRFPDRLRLSQ